MRCRHALPCTSSAQKSMPLPDAVGQRRYAGTGVRHLEQLCSATATKAASRSVMQKWQLAFQNSQKDPVNAAQTPSVGQRGGRPVLQPVIGFCIPLAKDVEVTWHTRHRGRFTLWFTLGTVVRGSLGGHALRRTLAPRGPAVIRVRRRMSTGSTASHRASMRITAAARAARHRIHQHIALGN